MRVICKAEGFGACVPKRPWAYGRKEVAEVIMIPDKPGTSAGFRGFPGAVLGAEGFMHPASAGPFPWI